MHSASRFELRRFVFEELVQAKAPELAPIARLLEAAEGCLIDVKLVANLHDGFRGRKSNKGG